MDLSAFASKWLHLLSIITVIGSTVFVRFVLLPAGGPDFDASEAGAAVRRRFGALLGSVWLLVLLTGFYNMYLVTPKVNGVYQMWLGIKVLLALVMFGLSMSLAHPLPALRGMQRGRSTWLALLVLLGAVVVGISAHLNLSRISGQGLKPPHTITLAPGPAPRQVAAELTLKVNRVVATVLVRDMDRALRFYSDTLGLTLEREEEDWALFAESVGLMLSPEPLTADHLRLNSVVLTLSVADVRQAYHELVLKGVPFLVAPTEAGGSVVASLHDTEGNLVQLVESR